MMTLKDKYVTEVEKVTHVAFGCGCVRTFHVKHPAEANVRCAEHGDFPISTTEELVPKRSAA